MKLRILINRLINRSETITDQSNYSMGQVLNRLNRDFKSGDLSDYEFKVYSQWGEDGIIQRLILLIDLRIKTFVEFGVGDFSESNCRFLLMNNNYSGIVIDSSKRNIESIVNSDLYWRHSLYAKHAFIDKENINDLIFQPDIGKNVGILSIDIDGVDYYIFEAIKSITPCIVICEYNSLFGPDRLITIPYEKNFHRQNEDNLFYGASIAALTHLANQKGFELVYGNMNGNNLFFVRRDLINDKIKIIRPEDAYRKAKFRESKNNKGKPTFLSFEDAQETLRGKLVLNVQSGEYEKF